MSRAKTASQQARKQLDAHLREIVNWHFSEETGCPFWLNWKHKAGWDPIAEVATFDDIEKFPRFQDDWLRDIPNHLWVPKPFKDKPFKVFESGGTTGAPKQRIDWEDHLRDFDRFSQTLDNNYFPRGGNWLMLGPTGPRRLRLAIEHLANIRGGACYFVDLDPRFIKKLIQGGDQDMVDKYVHHVVDQALLILKHGAVSCLYTTPKLLEALGERCDVHGHGIIGVVCGGTSISPQEARFLQQEVLGDSTQLVPVYGNTLMGVARSEPLSAQTHFEVIYHAPQPTAVLRVVDPANPSRVVDYGQWGRVELTTLTRETFIPRFLERDEAIRCSPTDQWPWDGVGRVRPFRRDDQPRIIEGVY